MTCVLWVSKVSHSWIPEINPIHLWHIILFIYVYILFVNIIIIESVLIKNLVSNMILGSQCQHYVSLIEWVGKFCILLHFERVVWNWYFFLKCLIVFTSEPILEWYFLCGEIFNYNLISLMSIDILTLFLFQFL